ncbi:MAG TPA: amino acid ABC transporter permease [Treponemataceae bacterium]|nr:amino acid ABC transporter permease [Treponemataceae bacterium]
MSKMLWAMLQGTFTSLEVFFLTLLFSIPLALPIAFGRMSKNRAVSGFVNVYLLIMRGTPLILQLIFVYFAPYYLLGVSYDRFIAVIIAFVINYAAYFAEIYRGGIESIPKGQYEAAKVLGFTKRQTFMKIVLPQVVKRILPSSANEVITLVKDTALAQTIGVAELFRVAQNASARQFSTMPIFVAGVFYFAMNWVVSAGFDHAEKKLSYYR